MLFLSLLYAAWVDMHQIKSRLNVGGDYARQGWANAACQAAWARHNNRDLAESGKICQPHRARHAALNIQALIASTLYVSDGI